MLILSKYWESEYGNFVEMASDEDDIGDIRNVVERFPICEHCGGLITGTKFIENNISLCSRCSLLGKNKKTLKAWLVKKLYKGTLVKQKCVGVIEREVKGCKVVSIEKIK